MIIVLIAIIMAFFVIVTFLYLDNCKQMRRFKERNSMLKEYMVILNKQQEIQANQLKLSDSLLTQLKNSNQILNENIYNMNVDLFLFLFNKNNR